MENGIFVGKNSSGMSAEGSRIMYLQFVGRDSWSRPVYLDPDGQLWKDVDPRRTWEPKLCTVIGNSFDGEPDTPMAYIKRYAGMTPVFSPRCDLWEEPVTAEEYTRIQ